MDLVTPVRAYHEQERTSESGKLYPSSLGGCIRAEMMRHHREHDISDGNEVRWNKTHPMTAETRWKLKRFGWYEQAFIKALDGTEQVRVETEHWSGKLDLLMDDGVIVEIKSVHPWAAKHGNMPYDPHKLQVWAYWLMVLEDSHGPPPTAAYIVYITRWNDGDLPEIYQYEVTPRMTEIEMTRDLMDQFESWSKRDELPPIPFTGPEEHDYLCTGKYKGKREIRCEFFGQCWPDHVNEWGEYKPEDEDEYLPF